MAWIGSKWNADHFNIPQPETVTQFCRDLCSSKLTIHGKIKFSPRFNPDVLINLDIPVLANLFYSGIFTPLPLILKCRMYGRFFWCRGGGTFGLEHLKKNTVLPLSRTTPAFE